MKVALVSCANGFGHLKRSIRILHPLIDRSPIKAVTLFCDERAGQEIDRWREYLLVRERCSLRIVPVSLPVRWNPNREYYGEWLLNWHTTMRTWRLEDFDYVLSDNLVEPLLYSDRVTLSGSFFWHDVLFSAFAGMDVMERYMSWCGGILASVRPHVIANRHFVTPAVTEQVNVHKIGFIHFCGAREVRQAKLPTRVLIALGSAQGADGAVDKIAHAIRVMHAAGMEIFLPAALFAALGTRCPGTQPFDFWHDNFDLADLAIIRGGLGTISDCIAAKVPMLYVDDPNPEIRFNQTRLSKMGIGLPLDKVLDETSDILTDPSVYRGMLWKMRGLELQGHIEAAKILAKIWEFNCGAKGWSTST